MNMSGEKQMALDVMLLEKVKKSSSISLAIRFYNWDGFYLSIGKNQKHIPENWLSLVKKKELQIVRRPSGGNAVLHGGGLTYSLFWKSPPRKKHEAYYLANQWIIKGFAKFGVNLKFGNQIINTSEKNCFSTSTPADLVDQNGQKRVGSAQLWRKSHLLQHGEILLDPPKDLWKEIFSSKPPEPSSNSIPREGLDEILYESCRLNWPEVNWQTAKLTQKDLAQITINSKKYTLEINQSLSSINPEERIVSTA